MTNPGFMVAFKAHVYRPQKCDLARAEALPIYGFLDQSKFLDGKNVKINFI